MKITVGDNRCFNLQNNGSCSCLGFDVVRGRTERLIKELREVFPEDKKEILTLTELEAVPKDSIESYHIYKKLVDFVFFKNAKSGWRSSAELVPGLVKWERQRVEIEYDWGETERGIVGKSTGWIPCHILLKKKNSIGGAGIHISSIKEIKLIEITDYLTYLGKIFNEIKSQGGTLWENFCERTEVFVHFKNQQSICIEPSKFDGEAINWWNWGDISGITFRRNEVTLSIEEFGKEMDMYPLDVVFREFKGKDAHPDSIQNIIALFPEKIFDRYNNISSYVFVGQHGAASRDITDITNLIKKENREKYWEMKTHLEQEFGYVLRVVERMTNRHQELAQRLHTFQFGN